MNCTSVWVVLVAIPLSLFPIPRLSAQRRAITFDDFIALKTVGDPELSPDGKWVAYTVTANSLQDNRGVARIWLADIATGGGQSRQVTQGPGSDRSPRWSPDGQTLAFLSTRQNGSQIWVLSLAGGEARRVSGLPDGVGELYWLPDGKGFLAVSDIKWPADQEIDIVAFVESGHDNAQFRPFLTGQIGRAGHQRQWSPVVSGGSGSSDSSMAPTRRPRKSMSR